MKHSNLLTLFAAALFVSGSAVAGPNCKKKQCPKDNANAEVYEVVERDGEAKPRSKCNKDKSGSEEGVYEVAERKGENKRVEKPDREKRKDRKRPKPFAGLDLSDDQKKEIKAIMSSAKEEAKALAKATKENGEKPDRKAMMAIRKGAMQKVYETVLNDEQKAKVDKRRKKMKERRAKRGERGEEGERPKRKREGDRKKRGDSEVLDL